MRGISKRKTSLGWNVVRVHYSADPDKDPRTPRGKAWLDNEKQGISDARFRKEYEIDYGALGGQLVFPDFDESIHCVPHQLAGLNPERYTIWMGADPHPRTAHAFLWLAVNSEDDLAVVWSWWPEERHAKENLVTKDYADNLKAIDESPLNLEPYIRVMDIAGKSFNATEEENYFKKYLEHGIMFQAARKNRDYVGYDLISEALKPKPTDDGLKPRLTIWNDCGDNHKVVSQLKNLRYREWKGAVTDKDAPEEPQDKERHLVDCLSYALLDGPRFVRRKNTSGGWKPLYPALGY